MRKAKELTGPSAVEKKAWAEIDRITKGVKSVQPSKEVSDSLKKIQRDYGKGMTDWGQDALTRLIKDAEPPKVPKPPVPVIGKRGKPLKPKPVRPTKPTEPITGERVQNIYAAMGAEAAKHGGAGGQGMAKVRLELEEIIMPHLPKHEQRNLLAARREYHTGRGQAMPLSRGRAATRATVEALRRPGPNRKKKKDDNR